MHTINFKKLLGDAMRKSTEPLADLGSLFTESLLERFDELPLELQAFRVNLLKREWEIYNKRYRKNCGILGGAPQKWSDEQLAEIRHRLAHIEKSPAYLARKNAKNADFLAYEMLVEQLYETPQAQQILKEAKLLNSKQMAPRPVIKKAAKGIKQRVRTRKK